MALWLDVACDCTQLLSKKPVPVSCISPMAQWIPGVFCHQRPFPWWILGVEFYVCSYIFHHIPLLVGMKPPFFPGAQGEVCGDFLVTKNRPLTPCPTWGAASWWWAWTLSRLGIAAGYHDRFILWVMIKWSLRNIMLLYTMLWISDIWIYLVKKSESIMESPSFP